MKVSELIEALGKLDPDATVVLSRDHRSNGYAEAYSVEDDMVFLPRDGEVQYAHLTEERIKQGYGEEDIYEGDDGVQAIVIRPCS